MPNNAIIWRTFLNGFFKFTISIFFLILPTVAFCASWNVVWQDDFGVVEDSVCRDFADPNMSVPGHMVADVAHMADGYYGITNSTAWCFIHKKSINPTEDYNFVPGCDHTGNKNGGMLVVNVDGPGKGEHIYENNLKLKPCGSHKYRLSMFVANVSDALINPDLTLQVWNMKDAANPVVMESVHLSENDVVSWPGGEKNNQGLYTHKKRDWTEASVEFEAKTGDVLKIVILNNNPGGYGNDFALDDITLQRYDDEEIVSPVIEIENGMSNSSCVPTYTVNNIEALNSWKNIYNSVYFLWQYSTDDGYTWTNLSGESGIEKTYLQRDLPATGNEVYRLIITGGSDETEAQSKAEYLAEYGTPSDECDYFSISNIISQFELKDPPVAYLGIDNDITVTNQPEYDCENINHFVSLMTYEWDDRYTKYYSLWQYSYDENTWTDLPFTGSDFQFTNDFDGLTYFRVILAAREKTLAQVAKNGKSDDCDKEYFITNTVSIECMESCKKPEFEILSDQIKIICQDSKDAVEWKVRQTNNTKTTDIEWYSKAYGEPTWTLIAGETGETVSLPNPVYPTSYLFLAKNGKCVSDYIIFELYTMPKFSLLQIDDINVCEGTEIPFGTVEKQNTTYFVNDVQVIGGNTHVIKVKDKDSTIVVYATDGVCVSNEMTFKILVEKMPKATLQQLPTVICEGEKVDLIADAQLMSANSFKWEKDNVLITDADLTTTDVPTEDATYKFTITGDKCPAVESEVSVKVEKKADVTLQSLPAIICEGEKVDLIADAQLTSTNTFKWEKDNELISDAKLTTADIPTEDATYKFTIIGDKCPTIEKEVSVKVEKKAELTLSISDTLVCENSLVTLSVNFTNAPKLVWKQKNDGESQFSEISESGDVVNIIATTSATFIVESADEMVCQSAVSNEVSLLVEEPVSVLLGNVPTEVCEGTTVSLNASVTENCTSYGWKKNDNENFAKNELNAEDIPAESTTYEFWAKPLVCPTFSEKFVVEVEHKKDVDLTVSESRICKDGNVTLTTNYPYTEGIIWESKGENDSQFNRFGDAVSEIVDSPSDNTIYRVSAVSKLGCVENEREQEVLVAQPVGLTVNDISICEGDVAHLEAVTERPYDRIEWKFDGDSSANRSGAFINITPESNMSYNVVAYNGNCSEEKQGTITVAPIPRISSHEELGNHTYQMIVENTDETLYFDYNNGEEKTISNLLENAVVGKFYNVEVSNTLGCSSFYQFQVPFLEPEFPPYFYQGDENWQVKNIENYPNSTLFVYDRFGKLLFKENGNTEGWNGEYNGVKLPSTDYWYILDVPEIDKQYKGHFTLMRR